MLPLEDFLHYVANYMILFKTPLFSLYVGALITDIFLGNVQAWVNKEVDSSVGVRGSLKHLGLFSFVTVFLPSLSVYTGDLLLSQGVLTYFIYQYVISIIENLGRLGFNLPDSFKQYFHQLQESEVKKDDDGSVL